jgi:hypothetical protein
MAAYRDSASLGKALQQFAGDRQNGNVIIPMRPGYVNGNQQEPDS